MPRARFPFAAHSPALASLLLATACLLAMPRPAAAGANPGSYFVDLSAAQLTSTIASEQAAGRDLADLEAFAFGGETRFAAVFRPLPGTVHALVQATPTQWQDWLTAMNLLDGHYLDFEVGYFDGAKRYCGLFVEDGDDVPMPIRSTNTDSGFQALLEQYSDQGYSLVDFEAYVEPGGTIRYAGMWARELGTPMTHLFYGLAYAELSDLLSPLAGRPVDIERYFSPEHGGYRYALLLAQVGSDNHGWGLYRNETTATLASHHGSIADGDTFLIDLDVRTDLATPRYHAIWGKTRAPRASVAPYAPRSLEPLPAALANALATFETGGDIGLEARNLRTGQTFADEADRPFYLASVAKTAMHVRLFQHFASGHLLGGQPKAYTDGPESRAPWFVDERNTADGDECTSNTPAQCANAPGSPGLNACHFGQSFPLSRYDQAMMRVSDNAATSLLVDDPAVGLAHDATNLNEWLSGIPGVGRGVGLLTSIHDVDRTILWQGQQVAGNFDQTSYFLVPPWSFEPLARCGTDRWGDLADQLGLGPGDDLPAYDVTQGRRRYYRMGLNSASPRAWTRFLELFSEGDLLGADTEAAIAVMTEGSRLTLDPAFPNHVVVRGKGGSKGSSQDGTRAISQGNLFRLGPDTIAVSVFSNSGSWNNTQVGALFGTIGLEVLRGLAAQLVECQAGSRGFNPSTAAPGDPFSVWCAVTNQGGGDATAFDVTFRLSTNTSITVGDPVLGTVRVPGVPGGQSRLASLQTTLPAGLAAGTYYVAWEIDRELSPGDAWGEVGEIDESTPPHVGYATEGTLTVALPAAIFADGFESGTTSAWGP